MINKIVKEVVKGVFLDVFYFRKTVLEYKKKPILEKKVTRLVV
jgi:hypothetical protein